LFSGNAILRRKSQEFAWLTDTPKLRIGYWRQTTAVSAIEKLDPYQLSVTGISEEAALVPVETKPSKTGDHSHLPWTDTKWLNFRRPRQSFYRPNDHAQRSADIDTRST
jgi:hypothetical protein